MNDYYCPNCKKMCSMFGHYDTSRNRYVCIKTESLIKGINLGDGYAEVKCFGCGEPLMVHESEKIECIAKDNKVIGVVCAKCAKEWPA